MMGLPQFVMSCCCKCKDHVSITSIEGFACDWAGFSPFCPCQGHPVYSQCCNTLLFVYMTILYAT
jgi:hypothetical protein